jgi:hypothetical protein
MKSTVLLIAAIVISSTGFMAFKITEPEKSTYSIKYDVACQQCEVTYRDEQGNSKDITGIKSGWRYQFTGEKGQFVYVSAIDVNGAPVKVTILKDGETFATDEALTAKLSARAGTIL